MNRLLKLERAALTVHIMSLVFGLAGLLLVVPNIEWVLELPPIGQQAFNLSMQTGGSVYMVAGAITAALMGARLLGWRRLLCFMIPAIAISLGSELLGTSTGFPFGDYGYLNGLGYKIAGLVPFTIPLSWFYVGLAAYLLGRTVLREGRSLFLYAEAILVSALILTAWDFVLDPAMTQTLMPFWEWLEPGAFFGMPLANFGGWLLTGAVFMTVATLIWGEKTAPTLNRDDLKAPLLLYLANFGFATCMSLGGGIVTPVGLGLLLGFAPAVGLWLCAPKAQPQPAARSTVEVPGKVAALEVAAK